MCTCDLTVNWSAVNLDSIYPEYFNALDNANTQLHGIVHCAVSNIPYTHNDTHTSAASVKYPNYLKQAVMLYTVHYNRSIKPHAKYDSHMYILLCFQQLLFILVHALMILTVYSSLH